METDSIGSDPVLENKTTASDTNRTEMSRRTFNFPTALSNDLQHVGTQNDYKPSSQISTGRSAVNPQTTRADFNEPLPIAVSDPNDYMLLVLTNDLLPPAVDELSYMIRDASENIENTIPNSPNLVASASYKHGNYFRFPDVDGCPGDSTTAMLKSSLGSTTTLLSSPDQFLDVPKNTPKMRRARLKSISLDSDSARFVEDNLNVSLQELCLNSTPSTPSSPSQLSQPPTMLPKDSQHVINPRNKHQLKIELKRTDSGDSGPSSPTLKTPTLTQLRQKAISLDSDKPTMASEPMPSANLSKTGLVSASVPTTPKRSHLMTLQPSTTTTFNQNAPMTSLNSYNSFLQNHHLQYHPHQLQRVHGKVSRIMNPDFITCGNLPMKSVSNNNLKTLPEVMPPSPSTTETGTLATSCIDPYPSNLQAQTTTMSYRRGTSLLQRRGSNHSLTLNLAGSVGDLSTANSFVGSSTQIVPKKFSLLQRRGSNTSLVIQGSELMLNRFNSHGSLNDSRLLSTNKCKMNKPGCGDGPTAQLSKSNSNLRHSVHNWDIDCHGRSLQPGCTNLNYHHHHHNNENGSGSVVTSMSGSRHHPKFNSADNLHGNGRLTYCHIDSIDIDMLQNCEEPLAEDAEKEAVALGDAENGNHCSLRQISTKPLSPQSASEDFKMYLANIQYLQNASKSLNVDDIRQLNSMFKSLAKTDDAAMPEGAPNNGLRHKLREIHQEFWDLPTNHQEKPMVFGSQNKNRYKTILPNEHSRVMLEPENMEIYTAMEPYINANYIKGPDGTQVAYIATQGPMLNTIFDFWLMAMQTQKRRFPGNLSSAPCSSERLRIVMLTDFIENDRPKCAKYFPLAVNDVLYFSKSTCPNAFGYDTNSEGDEMKPMKLNAESEESTIEQDEGYREWYNNMVMDEDSGADEWKWLRQLWPSATNDSDSGYEKREPGDLGSISCFVVKNHGVEERKGYSIRELRVKYVNRPARLCYKFKVDHFWYPGWPDHKSPDEIDDLLTFALDLLSYPQPGIDLSVDNCGLVKGGQGCNVVPILHCSAGIGRTGCMVGILNSLRQMMNNSGSHSTISVVSPPKGTMTIPARAAAAEATLPNKPILSQILVSPCQSTGPVVDILGITCNLRLQRGGMVQNSEQYELIHRVLCLFQNRKDDEALGHVPQS